MNTINLSNREEAMLWNEAARRLLTVKSVPSIPTEWVDRLHQQLPARKINEPFSDFIRRASLESVSISLEKTEYNNPTQLKQRFVPLTHFVRLAADTSGSGISLPTPNDALESEDGHFRLRVNTVNGMIQITIQALGFAADEFAGSQLALANPLNKDTPIAFITLDQEGDGACFVKDENVVRQALLNPVLLLNK